MGFWDGLANVLDPPPTHLCRACGSKVRPRKTNDANFLVFAILLLFFVIPGLIYWTWGASRPHLICPRCKAKDSSIPLDSPAAGAALGSPSLPTVPMQREERPCPWCAEPILAAASVCKHCGRDVAPAPPKVSASAGPKRFMRFRTWAIIGASALGIYWCNEAIQTKPVSPVVQARTPRPTQSPEQREAALKTQKEQVAALKAQRAAEDKAQAAALLKKRTEYPAKLREHFLDKGFDIKVSTSGKGLTTLNLRYALFNDVWVHNFRKGDLMQEIAEIGFKSVTFDDGFEYSVRLTFK